MRIILKPMNSGKQVLPQAYAELPNMALHSERSFQSRPVSLAR